jgi:hypothetical protein
MCPYRQINKHLPTIRKIPDDLWDEIKLLLPPEKSDKTIARPVIPFRKVLDGIDMYTGFVSHNSFICSGPMAPSSSCGLCVK